MESNTMSEQLDRIEKKVDSITQVLGGDRDLGQKGLLEDYREIKGQVFKNKAEIAKMKWTITGITTAIGTAWGGFITWINS